MNRLLSPPNLQIRGRRILLLLSLVLLTSVSLATARGWLGVSVQDITLELHEAMDLPTRSGALISEVVRGSPAEEAGLRTGDVVVRIDDTEVEDAEDLVEMITDRRPDDRIRITVLRGDEELRLEATLHQRRDTKGESWFEDLEVLPKSIPSIPFLERLKGPQLGVEVYALDNRDLARYFQTEPGRGIVVLRIVPDSPAENAGIRPGDVLLRFNGSAVSSAEELRKEVRRLGSAGEWVIEGLREGRQTEWNGEIEVDAEPRIKRFRWFERVPESSDKDRPVLNRSQIRRFERELERLREKIRELERRLDTLRGR